jgi:hypothetical protein
MAGEFNRCLPDEGLALLKARPSWWQDLLDYRFKDVSGKEQPLFLAIRGGYLNAYVEGQSILKIGFVSRPVRLSAEIHNKYVYADDQSYLKFDGNEVKAKQYPSVTYEQRKSVGEWVKRARSYAGDEKRGVAVIVARNSHVIDVEMGLTGQPSVDRIDIVALEKDAEALKIVFYEAKLFSNHAALRADTLQPKVLKQLKRYEDWIRSRPDEIIPAYRRACGLLIRLHGMRYTRADLHAPSVHRFVLQAAKEGSNLQVDPKPRLIVFGYSPSERVGSWKRHECALRQNGVRLIMKPRPEGVILPEEIPPCTQG